VTLTLVWIILQAEQEFAHIEHHSEVGLQQAMVDDDNEERHAWGVSSV
jgi:hypothetical protein